MTRPLPLFPDAGDTLIEVRFSEFYRTRLCRRLGARTPATEVLAAYLQWAASAGGPSIGFKELKRLLRLAGHRHRMSDGAKYLDVACLTPAEVAALPPDLPDKVDQAPVLARAIERVDRAMIELAELRAQLSAMRHAPAEDRT